MRCGGVARGFDRTTIPMANGGVLHG
jgi:hypothetical protein